MTSHRLNERVALDVPKLSHNVDVLIHCVGSDNVSQPTSAHQTQKLLYTRFENTWARYINIIWYLDRNRYDIPVNALQYIIKYRIVPYDDQRRIIH
mmetsp:Transcript_2670/g.3730  ORF Transcript_2670/g.3730 Transcript_2670/m.3730 type:complete len:96 (+) Transcript_2670:3-290(+)